MDNTDSLDQTLTIDLEAIGRALKMYSDYVERIMESILKSQTVSNSLTIHLKLKKRNFHALLNQLGLMNV